MFLSPRIDEKKWRKKFLNENLKSELQAMKIVKDKEGNNERE